jgi:hypothetical protein
MDVVGRARPHPPAGCASCEHCYCRAGARRVRRHRAALVVIAVTVTLVIVCWGSLRASWDLFDQRADATLCHLVQDRC